MFSMSFRLRWKTKVTVQYLKEVRLPLGTLEAIFLAGVELMENILSRYVQKDVGMSFKLDGGRTKPFVSTESPILN